MTKFNEKQFEKAVEIIGNLPKEGPLETSNSDKLEFYGLFKQAKGETIGEAPSVWTTDLTRKPKWNAWNKVKDVSKEDAQDLYVKKLIEILKAAPGKVKDADPDAEEKTRAESEAFIKEIEAAA